MSHEAAPEKKHSEGLLGQLLASRYLIEYKLGEGAMGAVYRARHVKVGRPFAVKVLHRKLLEDQKVALRFDREAELAGRLHHPNVIGVVDVGETPDGLRYMVMDFAEGGDLAELLDKAAPMPPQRIIPLVRQLLEGLYHAHEAGLIHRDFKPENVIVERDDHGTEVPRIVDFGISILREGGDSTDAAGRLTTNGLVLGTPHYMAPEQAVADPIDHRIDLFAMGIVVYEMLCGRLPFDGAGAEVARANLLLDPPPISQRVPYLEVDPLLEAFARRLMLKKRDHRPANAKKARELLDLIERDRPAAAAALGVPLEASGRAPQVTQPVSQQHPVPHTDDEPAAPHPTHETAPARPLPSPEGAPVAPPEPAGPPGPRPSLLEAPPVQLPQAAAVASVPLAAAASAATPSDAISLGKGAPTTTLTDPLPWGGDARSSRRRWIIAGGAGLAAAGALVAIALGASGGDGARPAPPQKISMTATPAPEPAPPAPEPAPPVPEPALAPPMPEPAPPSDPALAKVPSKDPGQRPPPRQSPSKAGPARKTGPAKAGPAKAGPAKAGPAKAGPAKIEVAQAGPTQPDPTKIDDVSARALEAMYDRVGNAARTLKQSPHARAEADRLFTQWRLIKIHPAMQTEASRRAAMAKLAGLQREIAAAQAKQP